MCTSYVFPKLKTLYNYYDLFYLKIKQRSGSGIYGLTCSAAIFIRRQISAAAFKHNENN